MTDDHEQISSARLFAMAMRERSEPEPYYEALANKTVGSLPFDLHQARVLDLGCGGGHDAAALAAAGATVVATDLDEDAVNAAHTRGANVYRGDAYAMPFGPQTFDGVYCSNLVEHVPSVEPLLDEIYRVLRPGGWAWVSWTNWFSPWGGHHIIPFHFLGTRLGPKVYERLFGPPEKNVPGVGLFPTYVGKTLATIKAYPGLELVDAMPRYYPSQRWILSVPVLREVATWNCLLILQRR